MSILSFFIQERAIFGAGEVFRETRWLAAVAARPAAANAYRAEKAVGKMRNCGMRKVKCGIENAE